MKQQDLTPEEWKIELDKCNNSVAYFYNNYCRKEGMPEYTEEEFQIYIEMAKDGRRNRRGKARLMMEYPLTPNECIAIINKH